MLTVKMSGIGCFVDFSRIFETLRNLVVKRNTENLIREDNLVSLVTELEWHDASS